MFKRETASVSCRRVLALGVAVEDPQPLKTVNARTASNPRAIAAASHNTSLATNIAAPDSRIAFADYRLRLWRRSRRMDHRTTVSVAREPGFSFVRKRVC
jgi:hypothetical protein